MTPHGVKALIIFIFISCCNFLVLFTLLSKQKIQPAVISRLHENITGALWHQNNDSVIIKLTAKVISSNKKELDKNINCNSLDEETFLLTASVDDLQNMFSSIRDYLQLVDS